MAKEKKPAAKGKPPTKSQVYTDLAEKAGITRKQVGEVFDALGGLIKKHLKKDGDTCWVAPSSPRCWAVQSSDSAPVMVAIGAKVKLISSSGERLLTASELYNDDGIHHHFRSGGASESLSRGSAPTAGRGRPEGRIQSGVPCR